MSLYYVQKLLYQLNRDPAVRRRFQEDRDDLLSEYQLTDEERDAIVEGNIGLLYVMGVNGQILMHYSALLGQKWEEYLEAMREGVRKYGPVRAGLYTLLEDREQTWRPDLHGNR
ncbi:MAG: aromatic ring-opening dioxygenase subunit LigA [Gammaproteobacteria bacterium]|nr:aromatic ring-opening dioxygenase subunit LigA [Gammaproteobacteria bacterium]